MSLQSNLTQVTRIFISCTEEDEAFLHGLERQLSSLKREGLIECYNRYGVGPGVEWKKKAKEYLHAADLILLLISPAFVESEYCYTEEAASAMTLHNSGKTRVIPIIVRPVLEWEKLVFGELVSLPRGKAFSMWSNKDDAFSTIVKGIKETIDELHSKLRPQSMERPLPFWNVPYWRNLFFTGREAVLADLQRTFTSQQAPLQVQALSGLAGVGKTQVAVEYAYKYASSYQAVLWVHADSSEILQSSFVALAEVLDLPEKSEASQPFIVKAAKRWLQQNAQWLLVVNNLEDIDLLRDLVPSPHPGHILVTTRSRQYMEQVVRVIDAVFPSSGFSNWALCQRYLLQAQTVAKLIEQGNMQLSEAAQFLRRIGGYLQQRGLDDEAERVLLQASSITEALFGLDHPTIIPILNALAKLYHLQGRYGQAEPLLLKSLALGERFLGTEHFEIAESLNMLGRSYHKQGRYSEAEPVLERALALRQKLLGKAHPRVAVSMDNLATLYKRQGKYEQAEAFYTQALAIRQATLDPQHPSIAGNLNNLAVFYSEQGKHEQAEPLARQALKMYEQILEPEHPSVINALDTLAEIYQEQGKYSEAKRLYTRIFNDAPKRLGAEHPELVTYGNNLARLYFLQGKYVEAEATARQALTLGEKTLGAKHRHVGTSINTLADICKAQEQYSEAEELYPQALTIRETVLAPNDSNIAITLENYADVLQAIGRTTEAEELRKRAESIRAKQFPH